MQRLLAVALAVGALLWGGALLLAPSALIAHEGPFSAAAGFLYQGAGLICHQRPERSFHWGAVQYPVCARCLGLYLSAAAGALSAWMMRPRAQGVDFTRALLAGAALPTALTVAIEWAGVAHPSNAVRALSALPLGAAAAWVFISSLRAEARAIVEPRV